MFNAVTRFLINQLYQNMYIFINIFKNVILVIDYKNILNKKCKQKKIIVYIYIFIEIFLIKGNKNKNSHEKHFQLNLLQSQLL